MVSKEDIQAYKARWKMVEEIQRDERRLASLELRWKQLNAAYGIAKSIGLLHSDPTDMKVHKRWAILKEKATSQTPKI
jgi:hypothetical protein